MIDDHVPELSGIIFSDINLTKKRLSQNSYKWKFET